MPNRQADSHNNRDGAREQGLVTLLSSSTEIQYYGIATMLAGIL
jgi:hypothetical protein